MKTTQKLRPHIIFALIRYDKDHNREVFYYDRVEDAKDDYNNSVAGGYTYVAIQRLNRDYTEDTLQYHEVQEA